MLLRLMQDEPLLGEGLAVLRAQSRAPARPFTTPFPSQRCWVELFPTGVLLGNGPWPASQHSKRTCPDDGALVDSPGA